MCVTILSTLDKLEQRQYSMQLFWSVCAKEASGEVTEDHYYSPCIAPDQRIKDKIIT